MNCFAAAIAPFETFRPGSPSRDRVSRRTIQSTFFVGGRVLGGEADIRTREIEIFLAGWARSRLLGSLLLTIAEIPLERRAIQKLPAFSGSRINSRSSRLSLRLPLRRPAARGLALGSMLWLRSVLRVRPRAISVPLTRNCTELAALDAICRGLSVCNYITERFRIPLSPPTPL